MAVHTERPTLGFVLLGCHSRQPELEGTTEGTVGHIGPRIISETQVQVYCRPILAFRCTRPCNRELLPTAVMSSAAPRTLARELKQHPLRRIRAPNQWSSNSSKTITVELWFTRPSPARTGKRYITAIAIDCRLLTMAVK